MSKIEIEKATPEKLDILGISSWAAWECEPSEFDWEYSQDERAYVKAGHVIVHTDEGDVEVREGEASQTVVIVRAAKR